MTEPIKLPPLPMPDGTAYGDNRTIKGHYFMPEKVRAFATLAIEQATAELREQVEVLQSRAEVQDAALACVRNDFRECAARAEKAEAEAERLRATELVGLLRECKKVMKANSLFRNSVTHNDLSKRISAALKGTK